jgi:hypothetical protein
LIPEVFPALEQIFINGRAVKKCAIDITPLAQLEGLRVSLNYVHEIIGLERFAPDRVHPYPRPRGLDM